MDGYDGNVLRCESGVVGAEGFPGKFYVVLVVPGSNTVVCEGRDEAVEALGGFELGDKLVVLVLEPDHSEWGVVGCGANVDFVGSRKGKDCVDGGSWESGEDRLVVVEVLGGVDLEGFV